MSLMRKFGMLTLRPASGASFRRALAIAGVALVSLAAAGPAAAQLERVVDPTWTAPRTPDGQPDLQGVWGNKTITPIERPDGETRGYLSDEDMAALNQ